MPQLAGGGNRMVDPSTTRQYSPRACLSKLSQHRILHTEDDKVKVVYMSAGYIQ